jgi:hypothetical protein
MKKAAGTNAHGLLLAFIERFGQRTARASGLYRQYQEGALPSELSIVFS